MLYWFFVKGLGPIAIHRLGSTAQGLENIPHEGGAIIAANHLAVIDDALLPLTSPRMIHFMGKAEYFEGKGIKGKFKKWWFTSVGVFPVDRSGGSKSVGALNHAREIIEDGHLFGIHIEGTRSPDGRLYKGHTGAARLAGIRNRMSDCSGRYHRLPRIAEARAGHSRQRQDHGDLRQADRG